MKTNIIKENEGYIAKEEEILISDKNIDWPILKRTGGKFYEIHKDDKEIGDIQQGGVTKFLVEREDGSIEKIDHKERLITDKLIKQINPPDMIRVYRGGNSVLTIGTDFDSKTEAIEHKYTKDELIYDKKKLRIKTEKEILEDKKEKIIQLKSQELSKDTIKMVNGEAKTELETFIIDINKCKSLEELKLKV